MKIVKTKDGSHTVLHSVYAEHYHSLHGAVQESNHVFIKNGLALLNNISEILIFEMGFGTGLNALLSWKYAKKHDLKLSYYSIEDYPLTLDDAMKLNYTNTKEDASFFKTLHQSEWDTMHEINANFSLYKIKDSIENANLDFIKNKINLIFYDAFAPAAQHHLWQPKILLKMYDLLINHGHLSTYCAKGQFKRDLKKVGFRVQNMDGPPGKREMTVAIKE